MSFLADCRDVPLDGRIGRTVIRICHLSNGEAHSLERRADQQYVAVGVVERPDFSAVALIADQQGDPGLCVRNGWKQHR